MNKMFATVFAVFAFAQVGHAQELSLSQEQEAYQLLENEAAQADVQAWQTGEELERPGRGGPGHGGPGRGGPGRDHGGPGRPGPGRPDYGPGRGPGHGGGPGPRPVPAPGPRPPSYPPGPGYRTEYVTCGVFDYRYNECYINPWGVRAINLYQQHSYEPCIYGRTFGVANDRIWTSQGCRATFVIQR